MQKTKHQLLQLIIYSQYQHVNHLLQVEDPLILKKKKNRIENPRLFLKKWTLLITKNTKQKIRITSN